MAEHTEDRVDDVIDDLLEAGLPSWRELSVAAGRRLEDEMFSPADPPPVRTCRDFAIEGPDGEIPLRAYHPPTEAGRTLVFFHGGGFVLGTLDSIDGLCRRLCRRGEAVVLSVDYRRAPEHQFPAALDDATVATRWAAANPSALGVTGEALLVGGTSAGANLATSVARRTVREDGPDLTSQLLAYPMLDPGWTHTDSTPPSDGPLLEAADIDWFWEQYLRSSVDRSHPYVAPLAACTHAGLPPATVLTAGRDVLGPEGQAYATALRRAGVSVDHQHYPAMPHGFLSLVSRLEEAEDALETLVTAMRRD